MCGSHFTNGAIATTFYLTTSSRRYARERAAQQLDRVARSTGREQIICKAPNALFELYEILIKLIYSHFVSLRTQQRLATRWTRTATILS